MRNLFPSRTKRVRPSSSKKTKNEETNGPLIHHSSPPILATIPSECFPSSDDGSETETEQKQKKRRNSLSEKAEQVQQDNQIKPVRKLGYVVCAKKQKVSLLIQLLKRHHRTKKILVLFASSQSAEYHTALLEHLNSIRPHIYITENTEEASKALSELQVASSGLLFSLTQFDPEVFSTVTFDYVYHYEQYPMDPQLLTLPLHFFLSFVYPHEVPFLRSFLPKLSPVFFSVGQLVPLDHKIENKNKKNYFMYRLAWLAYRTTLPLYAQWYRKEPSLASHVHELPEIMAAAFGFSIPPRVKY